ncbi:hypothetical protein [Hugenholtzia roseola]|uniref:hypothetical protein n=1 Tax=Hugenholtzia roseola TaxID=1002 RepID=UPI0004015AA4|nr:hypothetical protein [Hugenholtzia roseola]
MTGVATQQLKTTPKIALNLQAAVQKAQQEHEEQAQKQQAQNLAAQAETKAPTTEPLPDQAFDQKAAQAVWASYLGQNDQQSWIFGSFFRNFKVSIENQTDLILLTDTDNPTLREEFDQQIKERFAIFARDRLQNQQIQVFLKAENSQTKPQVGETDTSDNPKKVFTNEEKFNYLEQHYPQLSELRKRFNLDIE